MVLVPLRPAPATKSTLRGYVAASVRLSSLLGCSARSSRGQTYRRLARHGASVAPMFAKRRPSLLSVVVPAYDVAAYLPACLRLGARPVGRRSGRPGSRWSSWTTARPTTSGEIAESYAARDPRVRVVHTDNRGLGAARNEGLRHVTGDLLAFADSDDVVPPGSYADAAAAADPHRLGLRGRLGGPLGARAEGEALVEPPWMQRLHRPADGPRHRRPAGDPRRRVRVEQAVPHRLLARRPGCPGPRGSATRTSRPPRWPTCGPGGSGSSPRSSTTGGSARTAPRSPSSAPRRRTCATAGRPS